MSVQNTSGHRPFSNEQLSLKHCCVTRLSEVKGEARLLCVEVSSETPEQQRLLELGFVPGASIHIVRNDTPMILELGGARLAFARSLAEHVKVIVC